MGSRLMQRRDKYTNTYTHMSVHTQARITHTNQADTVTLDIALGLIMNTRTAKYLTPRLSVHDANTQTHTHTLILQRHTQFNLNQE